MLIRAANEQDLPVILAITNHAITQTTASWQTVPTDLAQRRQWLRDREAAGQPVLVAEIDGDIAGFATYGSFRAYGGYALTVEHSIYVDGRFQGQGLGRAFLTALLDHATAAGMHVMVGAISADNAVSIKLHEQFGFTITGRMPEVGQKFGRWLDLVLMQKTLSK
ncbi:N-acetyltransferase [Acidisoma cellulosilytica]|uniref:N-acetyltransferase n=1 Tax=Acidisoma cellulosilyticum TaxID=2802395 RepID=A0A963Z3Z0_9PROT|nr:GNAT family N-acetyltransferase [Acidisoma cellulosilyticum]MCB8882379.1 N-acetyltransferase [Acidisoma cellulosilyticum]